MLLAVLHRVKCPLALCAGTVGKDPVIRLLRENKAEKLSCMTSL